MKILTRPLRVMHIVSGDVWAGLEAQVFTLVQHMHPRVELKIILFNEGELAQRLRGIGLTPIILPELSMSGLRLFWHIFMHIFIFKPQIVHTHRQKEHIFGSFANRLNQFVGRAGKCLRTAHGAPELTPRGIQRLQVWLDLFVARHLQHAVIAVSEELKVKLAEYYLADKIHVVRNGVDIAALTQNIKPVNYGSDATVLHIGIVGRLEAVKRVDLFLKVAAILQAEPNAWRFHVIGAGKLQPQLVALASQLGLGDVLKFHGHRQDIPNCIAGLNAVVMCSDHEGTPMTALETLALGVPLVAHNVGGLRELLQEFPAFRVDDHQADAYANCLKHVCQQTPSPRIYLNDKYSAAMNLQETLALYERLHV